MRVRLFLKLVRLVIVKVRKREKNTTVVAISANTAALVVIKEVVLTSNSKDKPLVAYFGDPRAFSKYKHLYVSHNKSAIFLHKHFDTSYEDGVAGYFA